MVESLFLLCTLGKSRKITLGSLFKRSTTDESGVRGSSKERGSSRSKKKKSADVVEPNVGRACVLIGVCV